MSFNEFYINHSIYKELPFINDNSYTLKTSSSTYTIDGVKYSVGTASVEEIIADFVSTFEVPIDPINPLFSLKSATENRYINFFNSTRSGERLITRYYGLSSTDRSFDMGAGTLPSTSIYYCMLQCNGYLLLCHLGTNTKNKKYIVGNGYLITDLEKILGALDTNIYSNEYGGASKEDGYRKPTFDNSSDFIGIPSKPNIGVSTAGFINVYSIDNNALVNLGSEIFPKYEVPPPLLVPDDLTSALVNGLNEQVKALGYIMDTIANKNIVDYVIDCHCIPITPSYGESESVKIGGRTFTPQGKKVTSDYIDFDCGSLSIGEYYNNFIDYVGTRAKLYLPFIGFVPLQAEYFQNGTLSIKYRFNVIDGSFMCFVVSTSSKSELTNSVIASYGGNACIHIPLTGLNYSNMISSVLNGTTATVANISSGNIVGAVNSAMNTLAVKPDMQSSNGYNATSAYLGVRFPYLVIEREVSNFSEYYTSENGLPCNITKSINELSGYIEMDNIHMETLTCTDTEKEMIEELLKNGIIV